jgi:hypothetical protein
MDLTGARWGLHGAEAILKLRALRSNGDFDDYWTLCRVQHRVHYAQARITPLERADRSLNCRFEDVWVA